LDGTHDTRSEREKMLAGELYSAADPELVALQIRARDLTRRYNATGHGDGPLRLEILRELFGAVGPTVMIEPPFHCDYGLNIHADDGLYMNFGCVVLDVCEVRIGAGTLFAPYCQLCAATHPTDPEVRRTGLEMGKPISIGSNVWVGAGAVICPGVTIGDDTTIGAGSVVTRDVPGGVVAAGNPCRVLREA
jgi:maltose O-acetyltransferase